MDHQVIHTLFRARRLARHIPAAVLAGILAWPSPATAGEFDSSSFEKQLKKYVADGNVDYEAWKTDDRKTLAAYLDSAADYDLTAIMGKEPKAAFLINVYNAWVVHQILEHYPVKSVDEIPGMFDKTIRAVAGEEMTLDGIEEKLDSLLRHRPQFALALARGTRGGPKLIPEAFTDANFDELLGRYITSYLVNEKMIQYHRETNELLLPVEVQKYLHRYENFPGGLAEAFSNSLPLEVIVALNARKPEFITPETDRALNTPVEDQKAEAGDDKDN